MKKKVIVYTVLHLLFIIYALCSVFSKYASNYEIFSFKFILFYGISMMLLAIYTIAWQQILKKIPLIVAFLNKSVTIIWGMFFGLMLFDENISIKMIIGAILVLAGVSLVVTEHE